MTVLKGEQPEGLARTVYPRHGDGFEQHSEQHGVPCGVAVQQVEEVESSL